MYENLGVQNIVSDTEFDAYRVIGADSSGAWAYTDSTGNVLPLAITTGASATKTAQGQWVTPAILLGGSGAIQVELDASCDVILGTLLFATDDGKVLDQTSAEGLLDIAVLVNNAVGASLVAQSTDSDESAIITATTSLPLAAVGSLFVEES
jgi:hypothetical protein